jgi:hypothetical protein
VKGSEASKAKEQVAKKEKNEATNVESINGSMGPLCQSCDYFRSIDEIPACKSTCLATINIIHVIPLIPLFVFEVVFEVLSIEQ